ncbi:MAG: DUF1269 domain-containing protein [Desulfobacterales bacterium]|jgi:uncharacterized membrane protein
MSELIAVAFDDIFKAEQVRLDLLQMEQEHLVDLEEAAVVVRKKDGKVKLHHVGHFTIPLALGGGFVGVLAGLIVINPAVALFGLVAGSGLGAAIGCLKEIGIDEKFMKELGSHLKPGTSALFIVTRKAEPEAVLKELKRFGGHVLRTSLKHDDEARLRAALEAVKTNSEAETD